MGRLLNKHTREGQTSYQWSRVGELLSITSKSAQGRQGQGQSIRFEYDTLGQLTSETTSQGTLRHAYDPLGSLTQA
ncbi:MAG: hypothetical protein FWF36_07615 [Propionibacteriaceae bacterium]|nr:hypothetical protein [Propionibacteriaceae bacterium]